MDSLSQVSTLELHELFYIFSLTITIFTSSGILLFNRVAMDNKHTVCPPPLAKGANNHHSAIHWLDKNSKLQCDKICFYINSMPPFCIRLAENHSDFFFFFNSFSQLWSLKFPSFIISCISQIYCLSYTTSGTKLAISFSLHSPELHEMLIWLSLCIT